jgi:hypothetical protein
MSGNKVRKLEFLMADVVAQGRISLIIDESLFYYYFYYYQQ